MDEQLVPWREWTRVLLREGKRPIGVAAAFGLSDRTICLPLEAQHLRR
jgi:hypothetical protein